MRESRWLPRTGFVATLAVGVGLVGSSLFGLAQVGQDLELAASAARPAATLVAERGRDCPREMRAPEQAWGDRL
jgi:hypothetical protein